MSTRASVPPTVGKVKGYLSSHAFLNSFNFKYSIGQGTVFPVTCFEHIYGLTSACPFSIYLNALELKYHKARDNGLHFCAQFLHNICRTRIFNLKRICNRIEVTGLAPCFLSSRKGLVLVFLASLSFGPL